MHGMYETITRTTHNACKRARYAARGWFHVSEVLGQYGKPFKQYKFRTMYSGAENEYSQISKNGLDELGKPNNDPRITPVGKILRKYFIDEIPQLANIIRGDMNLVGPRPQLLWQYFPQELRKEAHLTKPGMLGVNYYKKAKTFEEMVSNLEEYMRQRKKNPVKTDIHYGLIIMGNILYKGTRSR